MALLVQARQHRAGLMHARRVGPVGEQAAERRPHLPRLQRPALRRLQAREVDGGVQLEQVLSPLKASSSRAASTNASSPLKMCTSAR
jgi:hypothetical protein